MSFENAHVPLGMFLEDGTMFYGTKCEFMHKLEDLIPGDSITYLPNVDIIIWDGHAVIQLMSVVKGPNRIRSQAWHPDSRITFLIRAHVVPLRFM